MKIDNGQTILFTGDSITDCGRGRSFGAGEGLGEGYVALVESLFVAFYPERRIRVINTGVGGNRLCDLEERWQTDIVDHAPDWLSVMIGINDVWQQVCCGAERDQMAIREYESTYRKILAHIRPDLKGLVLMTPYCIEPDRSDPMRQRMDAYGMVVKRLAHELDALFVDVQGAFDRYLIHRSPLLLADDRVHPNKTGHMIIARSFLTVIEFDWIIADLFLDES